MLDEGGGTRVAIDVAGMQSLLAGLRQVDALADQGPAGLPEPAESPPGVRLAVADLAEAVQAGAVAIHEEVEVLAAFVDGAVQAFEHLDQASVAGKRP